MESYNYLAKYYDMLMDDVNYELWCDFIETIFSAYNVTPNTILDTACGTGNITIPMAAKGYTLWGADISEEMLAIAENKARSKNQNIKFVKQNMTELTLNKCFDAVLCMCDGVNYIIEEKALKQFFKAVYNSLNNNGVFIFDISSSYKLTEILGDNTLFQEKNDFCYVWENSYYEDEEILEMRLNFFVPEKGMYKRMEEFHSQKAYSVNYIEDKLIEAGFDKINIYDDLELKAPSSKSERIFFAAHKL
ncbi:MAG: class I SAM-dependent methyltransferase [Lutisporaceae bacterium]